MFPEFDLVNPNHDGRMTIFKPCGSKKIAKMSQIRLIRTNRGQNHDPGGCRNKRQGKHGIGHDGLTVVVTVVHDVLCSPESA